MSLDKPEGNQQYWIQGSEEGGVRSRPGGTTYTTDKKVIVTN